MKTLATLLLSALLATSLVAQTSPPGPPSPADHAQRQVKFLTTMLSLTAAQQQQATTIFTDAATAGAALHQSMRDAHQALDAAVKSNNTTAIDQAAASIGQLTTQLTSLQAKAHAAFFQILTPDQQNKMSAMRMHDGPGGFGGPGPFFMQRGGGPPPPRHD